MKTLKIFSLFLLLRYYQSLSILKIIKKSNYKDKKQEIKVKIDLLKSKSNFNEKDKNEYVEYVLNQQLNKSDFVPISDTSYKMEKGNPKLIAFYLPQFYTFDSNDKWFGKGFTEWTNTTKTVPQYTGHYQPHLPIDTGYYNLDDTKALKRQVELAKKYGIHGFCFYYYWFSGARLMEKPIFNLLNDKSIKMPFCLFWANENWSKLWDGGNKEVLHEQRLNDGDDEKFMEDIMPFFKDERYIKVDGKPLLIIYRPTMYTKERFIKFTKTIKEIAKKNGFKDLHLVVVRKDNITKEMKDMNFDAAVEFFPCDLTSELKPKKEKIMNKEFKGVIFDMNEYIDNKRYLYKTEHTMYKCCFPNWDNTARKCYSNAMIMQNTPEKYKTWLLDLISWTKENNKPDEQFIFINAWNEWAEGTHLEPDQRYGYAYLQATKEALEESRNINNK